MIVVSWNVWDLGDATKEALVRKDLGAIKENWVVLQETKL